jgi:hypothetical protein
MFGRSRVSVLGLAAVLAAGCGGSGVPATPSRVVMPETGQAVAAATPQEVRLRLEALLGQHSILMIRLMRGTVTAQPDFVEAATAALGRNTRDLSAAVASVYGAAAGQRFEQSWATHVNELFRYARAVAASDEAGKAREKQALADYTRSYGTVISSLTGGELPAAAVTKGVAVHIGHLVDQVDAYARRDYVAAYKHQREAYAHMFTNGKNLAAAAVSKQPGELPAGFDTPPQRLRSTLGQLLGEHEELAVDTTRAVTKGSPDFRPAAGALDGTTRDLSQATDAVFGPARARQFNELWGRHIDAVVAFAVALADKNQAGEAKAQQDLQRSTAGMGAYLTSIAPGKVPARAVAAEMQRHDQDLIRQLRAYAAADYPAAHDLSYAGYHHMFSVAGLFASAVEGRMAVQMPHGGAATGAGGAGGSAGG